jgi:hypothetical protein
MSKVHSVSQTYRPNEWVDTCEPLNPEDSKFSPLPLPSEILGSEFANSKIIQKWTHCQGAPRIVGTNDAKEAGEARVWAPCQSFKGCQESGTHREGGSKAAVVPQAQGEGGAAAAAGWCLLAGEHWSPEYGGKYPLVTSSQLTWLLTGLQDTLLSKHQDQLELGVILCQDRDHDRDKNRDRDRRHRSRSKDRKKR